MSHSQPHCTTFLLPFPLSDREREAPPKSEKEMEIDSKNSWRSDRKAGEGASRGGFRSRSLLPSIASLSSLCFYSGARGGGAGRGGAAAGPGRTPEKKWVEDSDGYKHKREEAHKPSATPSAGGSWAAVASKATTPASEVPFISHSMYRLFEEA